MSLRDKVSQVFGRAIESMVSRPRLAYVMTGVIAVLGLLALYGTKRDLHPVFDFKNIQVQVLFPGVSGAEMERLLTYPLEEKLLELQDLEKLSSTTNTGNLNLTLTFADKVKDLRAREVEVRAKVAEWQQEFSSGQIQTSVESSLAQSERIFLANYALVGFKEKNSDHQTWLERARLELKSIPGVSRVESSARPLNIYLRFSPEKLKSLKISTQQIRFAVQKHFQFQSIGYYNNQGKEWLLEMEKPSFTVDELKNIVLFQNAQGNKILLQDIAEIQFDLPPTDRYVFLHNGTRAVELVLFKSSEKDSIDLFGVVQEKIKNIDPPEGVEVSLLYDGPYFIQQQISVLLNNGVGGLLLVLIMLSLAMSFKTSLMTALGLPISYFGTFIILYFAGASIDLISLIAMILVVGNLVDDAVIMAERYTQLLEEGLSPNMAASTAAKELLLPVTGTILTIICAFAPILFIQSGLSKVFFFIPVVVAAALALSWFETFFILPSHLAHHVKTPPRFGSQNFFFGLARIYRKLLSHTLKWRYAYGALSAVALVLTLIQASKMSQDFGLYINAPQVEVFAEFPVGTTLEQAETYLKPIHEELKKINPQDIDFLETHLGWSWRQGKSYSGPRYATIRVVLNKQLTEPKDAQNRVSEKLKPALAQVKKDNPHFLLLDLEANLRGGSERVTETATVVIRGKDDSQFALAEQKVIETFSGKEPVGAFIVPDNILPISWIFQPDMGAHRALGLSTTETAGQIQALTTSARVEKIRDQGAWREIYLEPSVLTEPSLQNLQKLSLVHPENQSLVPLNYLGSWTKFLPQSGITHENGERILKVQFRFDSQKTNEIQVQQYLENNLSALKTEFPRLKISAEDSNERDRKGREWILKNVGISAVLILLILFFVLQSWSLPFIVGFPIPFAMVGVIWALKLHDLPLGLMSMIGLIGTMGVAVNDSIVMVDQIQRLKKKYGHLTRDLLIEGAASRLRSISLTATCTLIGVFPTAYGWGGESGFTQPLAFAMGWGLTTSLLLTLFIIPAMIWIREDLLELFRRKDKFDLNVSPKKTTFIIAQNETTQPQN
ncbi:MAG: efflux RND transporter permease subunit [Pseudobdellovibrionaceae bacterium]